MLPKWAPDDQYFTHVGDGDEPPRHFSVARMLRAALEAIAAGRADVELVAFEPEAHFAEFCVKERAVDGSRVAMLTEEHLKYPLIGVEEADGTTLLIDGHHRYVRLFLDRAPEGIMLLFKRGAWEHLLVDLPPAVSQVLVRDVLSPDNPAHRPDMECAVLGSALVDPVAPSRPDRCGQEHAACTSIGCDGQPDQGGADNEQGDPGGDGGEGDEDQRAGEAALGPGGEGDSRGDGGDAAGTGGPVRSQPCA